MSICRESTGIQGTAPLPPPSTRARGAQSIPDPNSPLLGVQVPTHQVKVTVVAEVVAQRVLGDVVALATDQLPIDLGEERWGKDTCRDSTWSSHPRWWDPQAWGQPCPQLTSHGEEEQGRADARRAAVEPLLLVPDAPDHHAQTLGDTKTPQNHLPSVPCSQHPASCQCHPSHRHEEDTAHQCPRQR